jgi:hypothetical protein
MRRIDLGGGGRGLGRLEAGLIIIIQRTYVLPGENQAKPYARELSTPTHQILVDQNSQISCKMHKMAFKIYRKSSKSSQKLGRKILKKASNP